MSKIHPNTKIGAVSLAVTDLNRALDYYQSHIGFKVHQTNNDAAALGTGKRDLLILQEINNPMQITNKTGLYHFAVRVPNRVSLAEVLQRLVDTGAPFQGFSDHGVSEAIYLADPDGNGIEIYRDRPREQWPIEENELKMTTDPLDVEDLLSQVEPSTSMEQYLPEDTVIGHVHLKVAQLNQAVSFYRDVLGFDLMQRYGSGAAFLSAGGYHHHVGVNIWTSAGAPPPPKNTAGLQWYSIIMPDDNSLRDVIERIKNTSIPIQRKDSGYFIRDPSKNGILITKGNS